MAASDSDDDAFGLAAFLERSATSARAPTPTPMVVDDADDDPFGVAVFLRAPKESRAEPAPPRECDVRTLLVQCGGWSANDALKKPLPAWVGPLQTARPSEASEQMLREFRAARERTAAEAAGSRATPRHRRAVGRAWWAI